MSVRQAVATIRQQVTAVGDTASFKFGWCGEYVTISGTCQADGTIHYTTTGIRRTAAASLEKCIITVCNVMPHIQESVNGWTLAFSLK